MAFVGLNPGGGGPNDCYRYDGIWALPSGNGYFDERWGPKNSQTSIQRQVQLWHEKVGVAANESLCAQFVPFRSRSWAELEFKEEALAFASRLWEWVFKVSPARLFVTMGKQPAVHLAKIAGAQPMAHLPTGWGRQTIDVYRSEAGRRIVAMPHPSRYALLGRSNRLSEIAEASFRSATDWADGGDSSSAAKFRG